MLKQDTDGQCSGRTIAYMGDAQTDNPFIVLCPNAFQKKAINGNGATISIAELGDTVSYRMMPLGGTLLHEYMLVPEYHH